MRVSVIWNISYAPTRFVPLRGAGSGYKVRDCADRLPRPNGVPGVVGFENKAGGELQAVIPGPRRAELIDHGCQSGLLVQGETS